MKGRRKDIREIWVEPENQDEYKYRTPKDVSKRLKEMREILASVERPQASKTTIQPGRLCRSRMGKEDDQAIQDNWSSSVVAGQWLRNGPYVQHRTPWQGNVLYSILV